VFHKQDLRTIHIPCSVFDMKGGFPYIKAAALKVGVYHSRQLAEFGLQFVGCDSCLISGETWHLRLEQSSNACKLCWTTTFSKPYSSHGTPLLSVYTAVHLRNHQSL
jgi:hypothetical protein